MAAQAKEEWEKAMTELAQEEPDLLQHFQKLSEAAGKVGKFYIFSLYGVYMCLTACCFCSCALNVTCVFCVGTDTASQQEFTSCLKETLRGLAKNADNLQVDQMNIKQLICYERCKHKTSY